MKAETKNTGSILVITLFVIAMLSTVVMGMLQVNSEEIQLMRNQVYAAEALALAEAGLNKAFAQIRSDITWRATVPTSTQLGTWQDMWEVGSVPPGGTEFGDGYYRTGYDGSTVVITSGVTSWRGYTATLEAEITVTADYPHIIRIDNLKVNQYQGE